ncbi:hypothetical protein EON65_38080 [archaeon]|nr:MAG: hypothetical protein EON65_38080 [archaeon]
MVGIAERYLAIVFFACLSFLSICTAWFGHIPNSFYKLRRAENRIRLANSVRIGDDVLSIVTTNLTPAAPTLTTDSTIEQLSKTTNFIDDEVLCNSEGGNWKVKNSLIENANVPSMNIQLESGKNSMTSILLSMAASCSKTINLMRKWTVASPVAENIVGICDEIDANKKLHKLNSYEQLNTLLLKIRRQRMLAEVLRRDRTEYIAIATFLSSRISRRELPNVQGVAALQQGLEGETLPKPQHLYHDQYLDDCTLPKLVYTESILEKLLLKLFRKYVQEHIGYKSPKEGIAGLLDEGR